MHAPTWGAGNFLVMNFIHLYLQTTYFPKPDFSSFFSSSLSSMACLQNIMQPYAPFFEATAT